MAHDEFSFTLKPFKPHPSHPTFAILNVGLQISDLIFVPMNFHFPIVSPSHHPLDISLNPDSVISPFGSVSQLYVIFEFDLVT